MRKNILTLLVIFLCFTAAAIGDEKKRVAVMDFRNEANIQGREINYITDLVRGAARRALPANLYIVMTKENIIEMLPPGKRLVDCTGAQCIVEAGRIVGADYVVDGEVVNFSGELRLSLSIYDTHDGNLLDTRRAGAKKLLDLEKPVMQAGSQLFSFLPGAKRESQPHNDGGERPSPENSVVVPPPPPDPEFENRVQEEQAKIEAQRRLEAQRKAKLDSDFAQAKAYHDNAGYSDDAKKAAYRYFLEKWPGDPTYGPQVEQWLKFGDAPEGMVPIPAGSFMMGCVPGDSECDDDEKPQHRVTVSSFYMDTHEVTVAEYTTCVRAGNCKEAKVSSDAKWAPYYNWEKSGRENHPINGVDWNDATAYCSWQGKRLPTEAEWEYAARGGLEGKIYPWGDTFKCSQANADDETKLDSYTVPGGAGCDGYEGTSPVGRFPVNGYGLYDMAGNVWEWCSDWHDKGYYASSAASNPTGASSGAARVLRGGSWYGKTRYLRTSSRDGISPSNSDDIFGFRCVRDNK